MATTTARRSPTIFTSTCAVGALLLAACSSGDDTPSATLAEPPGPASAPVPTTAAPTDSTAAESESTTDPIDDPATSDPSTQPESTDAVDESGNDPADDDAADTTTPTTTALDDGDDDTAPPPDRTQPPAPTTTLVETATGPDAGGVDWSGVVIDLLDQQFRIPREPSLDLVRAVCIEPSGCFDDASRTVDVLLRDGVRLRGGAPFEVVSVEFQGTVDGSPVEAALAVNLIVRFIATEQGLIQLIDGNGEVVSDVAPDDRFTPGQPAARAVILGRDSVGAGWKLLALSDWM